MINLGTKKLIKYFTNQFQDHVDPDIWKDISNIVNHISTLTCAPATGLTITHLSFEDWRYFATCWKSKGSSQVFGENP